MSFTAKGDFLRLLQTLSMLSSCRTKGVLSTSPEPGSTVCKWYGVIYFLGYWLLCPKGSQEKFLENSLEEYEFLEPLF